MENEMTFRPSGLNSSFRNDYADFDDYIQDMRKMVKNARCDLTPENQDKIIEANTPKSILGAQHEKIGILLLHGLCDSPCLLDSIFQYFAEKGFTVRSVLLPGHGTRPGDLLDIQLEDWNEAVSFGIASLQHVCDQVILMGYSTGASLALKQAFLGAPIDKLVLFAPAIKIRNPLAFATNGLRLLSYFFEKAKWFQKIESTDYAKYQSIPFNAIYQVYRLTQFIKEANKKEKKQIPQFHILTDVDEVVDYASSVRFFDSQTHPDNKLIVYSASSRGKTGKVTYRCAHYPDKHILDFSHTSLACAPAHYHYGEFGDYQDFTHYAYSWGKPFKPNNFETLYAGAVNINKLKNYPLKRLSYNPDFDYLIAEIEKFILA